VASTKRKLNILIAVILLLAIVVFVDRLGHSWNKIRENCVEDIVGRPLLPFKEEILSNDIRVRCSAKENVCYFDSGFIGGSVCKITYSSDEIILSYEYFPADGEVR